MWKLSSILVGLRNRHFFVLDLIVFLLAPAVAFLLRTDGVININTDLPSLVVVTGLFTVIKLVVFYTAGMYSRYWRYASVEELTRIAAVGMVVLALETGLLVFLLHPAGLVAHGFPRSLPFMGMMITIAFCGAFRYSVRFADRTVRSGRTNGNAERVVVAGAGWAGVTIVKEMQRNPTLGMVPVAFLDDDPRKQRVTVAGVPVLGNTANVATVLADVQARKVVIAMPVASGKTIRKIVELAEQAGAQVKIIPGMHELLDGTVSATQLRDVRIEDLLRREPAPEQPAPEQPAVPEALPPSRVGETVAA